MIPAQHPPDHVPKCLLKCFILLVHLVGSTLQTPPLPLINWKPPSTEPGSEAHWRGCAGSLVLLRWFNEAISLDRCGHCAGSLVRPRWITVATSLDHWCDHAGSGEFPIRAEFGHLVFQSDAYQNDWGADGLPEATYYYVVDYPQDASHKKQGYFDLVR